MSWRNLFSSTSWPINETVSTSTSEFLVLITLHPQLTCVLLRFDYIARDCHAIGEKGNLSLTRLIHSARVINDQICYDIKDANQLYELCYTRFSLHKRIYNHKTGGLFFCSFLVRILLIRTDGTAKAIEYMIIDALLAAESHLKIADQVDDPDQYVFLTDDIMPTIERSTNPVCTTTV